jgi:GH15 family glucan-1,4-alpha-glucosidase
VRRYIEDFALIGDLHTAALVGRDGTIEWLCVPRFDSPSAFASLLGDEDDGCWVLRPKDEVVESHRRYIGPTLVLDSTMRTRRGTVRIIDFMPRREDSPAIVRIVHGVEGSVTLHVRLACRFDYGRLPPWTRQIGDALTMTVGADAVALRSSVKLVIDPPDLVGEFTVRAEERHTFVLQWYPSHQDPPGARDAMAAYEETLELWEDWASRCEYHGEYQDEVVRSLATLKALTFEPSGGCVAAVTTSLPEKIGGDRNWDYRYGWIRDSAITIEALVAAGYREEARAWRDWVLRALAGAPEKLQIMYTVTGEPRIAEYVADWLRGYETSAPVRIGNAAYQQAQHGIYGYAIEAIFNSYQAGIEVDPEAWKMLRKMLDFASEHWSEPDSGIWEFRGRPLHYTHSRVMSWRAFDCAIAMAEASGTFDAPLDEWRKIRSRIHDDVCRHAFNKARNAFVQSYENDTIDASVLIIPIVGFLPVDDARVVTTIEAVERELCRDGFVMRAQGLEEGSFLLCNFWLAQCYALAGRIEEAHTLFERTVSIANDVGLLSEEFDVKAKRQLGNTPQTFSHASLIVTALAISKNVPASAL